MFVTLPVLSSKVVACLTGLAVAALAALMVSSVLTGPSQIVAVQGGCSGFEKRGGGVTFF